MSKSTPPEPIRQDGAATSQAPQSVWNGLAPEFVRSAAADRLKALGHPDRLRIVEELARGGKHVNEIAAALRIPSATVSRHLRLLDDAQVVRCSRRGNFVLYVLADRDVARLASVAYRGAATQVRRVIALAPDPRRGPSRMSDPPRNGRTTGIDD